MKTSAKAIRRMYTDVTVYATAVFDAWIRQEGRTEEDARALYGRHMAEIAQGYRHHTDPRWLAAHLSHPVITQQPARKPRTLRCAHITAFGKCLACGEPVSK